MKNAYIQILREELVPAQGCTEPIALAFCAAKASEVLGQVPEGLRVQASGNIIKNVKSVIVPNTNGMKGIDTAAVFGALAGDAGKNLEVLSDISEQQRRAAEDCLRDSAFCKVERLETQAKLHMLVTAFAGENSALVEIKGQHTNIVRIEKNGAVLLQNTDSAQDADAALTDRSCLNIRDIVLFAQEVEREQVDALITRQIEYNFTISEEGLQNDYGASIGKTLLEVYGDNVRIRMQARAAAGSDARMSGSVLPVVINSGSGNQGMTASLPVIEYAHHIGADRERLIRALVISNLVAIHQKTKIGRLSAYCGAVSAAAGSVAGIAWLDGSSVDIINKCIVNTLANVSGIVCDGAKPSCAAKIATAVDAALMAYELAKKDRNFVAGDGIVKETAEQTISSVGEMASKGMRQTDDEIINIMIS